jgi:hypothetical protein
LRLTRDKPAIDPVPGLPTGGPSGQPPKKHQVKAKIFVLVTISVLVAGSLGYSIGRRSKTEVGVRTAGLDLFGARTRNLLELERAKIMGLEADWLARFNVAYSSQPPEVAIWEGTNLLSYLTGKSVGVGVGNLTNDVMLTHAKLSGLYLELGATHEAELHLEAAARIMHEKNPKRDPAEIREGIKRFTETNRVARLKGMGK